MLTHEFPPYPGGVGRYCYEIYQAARKQNIDLHVLAPDYNEANLPSDSRIHRFSGGVFNKSGFEIFNMVKAINAIFKLNQFDCIHVADWPMLIALQWARFPKSVKVFMTFYGSDALTLSRSRFYQLLRVRTIASRIDRCFSISDFTKTLVERNFPEALGGRSITTPLGVGAQWFDMAPLSAQSAARELAMANNGDQIVLTVARLDPRKGHKNAIRALAIIPIEQRKHICYLAIGTEVVPGYKLQLEQLANKLGVRAVFAGRQSDEIIKGAYASASAFLLPAEPDRFCIEGFGLVFLEASAQGLPSVATRVHAIPEVVVEGKNGWICPPGDDHFLANAIETAIRHGRDPQVRNSCVQHARQFTWERCAELTYGGEDDC